MQEAQERKGRKPELTVLTVLGRTSRGPASRAPPQAGLDRDKVSRARLPSQGTLKSWLAAQGSAVSSWEGHACESARERCEGAAVTAPEGRRQSALDSALPPHGTRSEWRNLSLRLLHVSLRTRPQTAGSPERTPYAA